MNDRYGWDDRKDRERYRREGSQRSDYDDPYRVQGRDSRDRWRSEDEDWRSRSGFDRDRHQGRSDFDREQRFGGSGTFGYGEGRVGGYGGSSYGQGSSSQSYAAESEPRSPRQQRHYTSSDYGYGSGQQGDTSQGYFTGQQQAWEVPSAYGAPGTFGASYGGGTGTYGGGAGGYRGFGEDYREHGYGSRRHERGFLERAGDEIASWFGDEDAARRREQDHRGRGPQDYIRSDERIREDANDRLTEDWRVDASGISVTVQAGEVTLNGTVSRREDKRRAEDIVDDISGVKHVQNNLRVQQNVQGQGRDTGVATGSSGASTAAASGMAYTPTSETVTKGKANTSPT